MTPTNTILQAIVDLLAADSATLAPPANANHVHLAKAAFTPGPNLDVGALTEATFTGSTPKNAGIGTQQVFTDPITGLRTIQILEPAGGWTWICTATPSPAETIYGWYATDNADATVIGSGLFPSPILINAAGQAVILGNIRFSFLATSPF